MSEFGFVVLGVVGGAVVFFAALAVYVYLGRKKNNTESNYS